MVANNLMLFMTYQLVSEKACEIKSDPYWSEITHSEHGEMFHVTGSKVRYDRHVYNESLTDLIMLRKNR